MLAVLRIETTLFILPRGVVATGRLVDEDDVAAHGQLETRPVHSKAEVEIVQGEVIEYGGVETDSREYPPLQSERHAFERLDAGDEQRAALPPSGSGELIRA